jgi:hypothetical protein
MKGYLALLRPLICYLIFKEQNILSDISVKGTYNIKHTKRLSRTFFPIFFRAEKIDTNTLSTYD